MRLGCYAEHVYTIGGGTIHVLKVLEYLSQYYETDLLLPPSAPLRTAQWYKENCNINAEKINIKYYQEGCEANYAVWINAWHSRCNQNNHAKQKYNIVWFPQVHQKTDGFTNVTLSEYTKKHIKERWGKDALVIYAPTTLFEPYKNKEKIILHVSRFNPPSDASDKGQEHMLEAFKSLNNLGWKFVLAGTTNVGPISPIAKTYVETLKKHVKDNNLNVEFVVNSPFEELKTWFERASIYWHCSGYKNSSAGSVEHQGLTIIESMSTGGVPISYNIGGPSEIIEHNKSGYLFDELKDLTKYTKKLIDNPQLLQKLSIQAIKRSQLFAEDKIRNQWVSLVTGSQDVTIIIGTHNNYKYLKACIKSIEKHTPTGYKLIVINNGSTDSTKKYLNSLTWNNLQVIHNATNKSYSEFNNQGIKEVTTKYVLFLNDDTVVRDNWLPPLTNAMYYDKAGAVGARLLYKDGTIQHDGVEFDKEWLPRHVRVKTQPDNDTNTVEVESLTGACLLTLTKLAGFSEEYKKGYYEDTDYILSLREKGYKIYLARESVITHYEGVTMVKNQKESLGTEFQNRNIFLSKWNRKIQNLVKIDNTQDILDVHKLSKEELRKALTDRFAKMRPGEKVSVFAYDFPILNERYMQTFQDKYIDLIYECKYGYSEIFLLGMMRQIGYKNIMRDTRNTSPLNEHLIRIIAEA